MADSRHDEATVAGRLAAVRERLARAAQAAGRDPDGVTLVAVSKTFPAEVIRQAYAAGQRLFGENYAQELRDKARELADLADLGWDFVGRLQRNKVKYVVGTAGRIHSLDSLELAQAVAARADAQGRVQDALIEVNLGGEAHKGGVAESDLDALLGACARLRGVRIVGLMTLPPPFDDPEGSRPYFRRLRELARSRGLAELSMGMSQDAEVAVAEGATLVRIGTAIFGERPHHGA